MVAACHDAPATRRNTARKSVAQERVSGVSVCGAEFASAIKRYVPRGHAFRGFPMMFNHMSPARIFTALLGVEAARAIMQLPALPTQPAVPGAPAVATGTWFALRVQVHVYAEDAVAAWVMLAATHAPASAAGAALLQMVE